MRVVLSLIVVLFALPAFAADVTQGPSVYVTTNTDIDATGEVIASSGIPTACGKLTICVSKGPSNNIVYVTQSASALVGAQAASLNTWGYPLYPVATSGETCLTVEPTKNNAKGKLTPVNPRTFYAASEGSDSKLSMVCVPW